MSESFSFRDRAEMEAATLRFMRRRSRIRADLRLLDRDGCRAVAKDWGHSPWASRLYGRWSLARECRILGRLAGVDGVPNVLQELPDAIILSHLRGRPLNRRRAHQSPPELFAGLEERVAQIHDRGVVHLDLRQRRNILLGADGGPFIVDFGAALVAPVWAGPLGRALLLPGMAADRLAILNFKAKYRRDLLSPGETRLSWLARIIGWLWPPHWFLHAKSKALRWRRNLIAARGGRL